MKKISQRQIFLEGEGDAWFQRNRLLEPDAVAYGTDHDPLFALLTHLPLPRSAGISVLEVGCGQGLRLDRLHKDFGWSVAGVDPSAKAIQSLQSAGISGTIGTADHLPVANASVDLLIFGFCLYLCDRTDLFRIAAEADRVLKPNAWLSILDFWSPYQQFNTYHHCPGINSYKSDLPAMFSWHPSYFITDHLVRHHENRTYTDDSHEWIAATILRKSDSLFGREG